MSTRSDGYICPSRDPPGQGSIYIIPGDVRREVYRLHTFLKYPTTAKAYPWELASAGFYYTGYKDRVKCSRCARQVADWQPGENPKDAKWHEVWRQFDINNREHNVPVNDVRQLRPQEGIEFGEAIVTEVTVLNPVERVVPALMPAESSNATMNQITEVATPQSARAVEARSIAAIGRMSQNGNLRELFPCENPVNPHMASQVRRLDTFKDHLASWQRNNIRATMYDMVEAGLYYLGERDKVKCWYCNGGLQNWAINDDPWFEHTKWFQTCEHVLRHKGPEYVSEVTRRFPNIGRENEMTRSQRPRESFPVNKPTIIEPLKEKQELRQRAHIEVEASVVVQEALKMGFDKEQVTKIVAKRLRDYDQGFTKVTTLVNALLEEPVENSEMMSSDEETEPLKEKGPHQELARLKAKMQCRQCQAKRAVTLLLPCGHLSVCEECEKQVCRCPACGEHVQQKVRTFRV